MALIGKSRKLGTGGIDIPYDDPLHGNGPPMEASNLARIVVQNPRFRTDSADSTPTDSELGNRRRTFRGIVKYLGRKCCLVGRTCFGDGDWLLLTVLGMGMAMFSFAMDDCIDKIRTGRTLLYGLAGSNVGLQYLAWFGPKLALVLISTLLCAFVAPQATGSGLPEMKTILRGVALREYLTLKTLITKAVALTLCLGSGISIGKEGPFVHICSIMATRIMKLMSSVRKSYENESVRMDMLAAACAVGVACTFGSPIGGVLFSIEVTSVYFAVRNYWRGFFAATCSAIVFRLTTVWFKYEVAFSQTAFSTLAPYRPEELIVYAFIGVVCGFGGPLFVILHCRIVQFNRNNGIVKAIYSKSKLIYPTAIVLITASLSFPSVAGRYMMSTRTTKATLSELFANVSWHVHLHENRTLTEEEMNVINRWTPDGTSMFATLAVYIICHFFSGVISNTLPIPTGVFIPTFIIGAAFGRMVGEFMYIHRSHGIFGDSEHLVVPGSYAVVGAAAFTGSVTHTLSTSVIVFELTGQIVYILPVMVAVVIANLIAAFLHPSYFDSLIRIKKLPYCPDMMPIESKAHNVLVKQFMTPAEDMKFITMETTIGQVKEILQSLPRVKAFPFVDSAESMILLGSIPRGQLSEQVEERVGEAAARSAAKRLRERKADERLVEEILSANENRLCASVWGTAAPKKNSAPAATENGGSAENVEVPQKDGKERALSQTVPPILQLEPTSPTSRGAKNLFFGLRPKSRQLAEAPSEKDYMTVAERGIWEAIQLETKLNFRNLQVDNAPIQLVERTSLHKAHSLFCLLCLQWAYVTRMGRLVGVVGLRDIRQALEDRSSHPLQQSEEPIWRRTLHRGNQKFGGTEGLIDVALQPMRSRKMALRPEEEGEETTS